MEIFHMMFLDVIAPTPGEILLDMLPNIILYAVLIAAIAGGSYAIVKTVRKNKKKKQDK